jgi:predicted nucleic acid-binding protein
MRVVFADTVYWVAITNPRDALHLAATEMGSRLGAYRFVTSEMVLVEVLNAMSGDSNHLRCAAADLAQEIMDDPSIELVPQTAQLFRNALALYRERPDKSWSMADCASFLIMEQRQITEALTHDRHFEQRGYSALLRD